MHHHRRLAAVAGGLYLLTVVTSIPALALKQPVLADPALLTAGGDAELRLQAAALLELVLALACAGTAVSLYPVVSLVERATALGFVAARTLEGAIIAVGILAMLALVSVAPARPDGDAAQALTALHDQSFLIGPGFIPAVNALLLGSLLYRARLVPRAIPLLGLVGAPLLLASSTGTLFGLVDQVSPAGFLAAVPIATWEIGLGLWLLVKGFRPEAVSALERAAGETTV